MNDEVSLNSTEEAKRFVGCSYKVSLMDLQGAIFEDNSLKTEQYQEMVSFKEDSSSQHLRQGRSLTVQL